jgi:hypothetical protein
MKNPLAIVVAVLVIGVAVLGYFLYEANQPKSGIDIKIGDETLSIQTE